jgi:hypothetical protein
MCKSKVGHVAVLLLVQCFWGVQFAGADVIRTDTGNDLTTASHDFAATGPREGREGIESKSSHALRLAGGGYRSGKHNKVVGKHHGY